MQYGVMRDENGTILAARGVTKDFPGVRALDEVSFDLGQAEVLGLVGENGAGKSTLMKILSGAYPYPEYEGEIYVNEKLARFTTPKEAADSGIAIIYQELNLIPELSVAENIFLGREPGRLGRVNWKKLYSDAKDLLSKLEIKISPKELIKNLSIGKQQMVEIAKAFSCDARILILDEPTSALTELEVEGLFNMIRSLKARGVAMIYISHKLDEIFRITDRITVLRDGKVIATHKRNELSRDRLVSLMVGRDIKDMYPKQTYAAEEVVLEVRNLYVDHPFLVGEKIVKDVSFKIRRGEILGISGLMGSGRSELVTAVFGALPADSSGEVYIEGRRVSIKSPYEAIRHGIGLVTEDRKLFGLVLSMSVGANLTLANLDRLSRFQIIEKWREALTIANYISELKIKTYSADISVSYLSGGNQQKVVIGKWLATNPKVLLLDEPTRGVDVGAKVEIYQLMNDLSKRGVAIVMVSSDMPEVLSLSDRILVMHRGRVSKELPRSQATQELIMHYATGGDYAAD